MFCQWQYEKCKKKNLTSGHLVESLHQDERLQPKPSRFHPRSLFTNSASFRFVSTRKIADLEFLCFLDHLCGLQPTSVWETRDGCIILICLTESSSYCPQCFQFSQICDPGQFPVFKYLSPLPGNWNQVLTFYKLKNRGEIENLEL